MNLIVDIGNTKVKCFAFDKTTIAGSVVAACLTDLAVVEFLKKCNFDAALIASTRGYEFELPSQILDIKKIVRLTSQTPIPIQSKYKSSTLGVDRIAAAVQAAAEFPDKEIVIFDFGTALTVDFVEKGVYIGGNISAGMSMRFKALNQFTNALPLVEPNDDFNLIGDTTTQAILNGVMNSVMLEVKAYIEQNQTKIIIFTGGEAKYFVKRFKMTIFADYELVPKGLNRILMFNDGQI